MRNTWLILRREYLERVRTRSFVLSTLLLPAVMIGLMVLPGKLATLKAAGSKRLAIVCADADFARALQSQLQAKKVKADNVDPSPRYGLEIVSTPDEATRAALNGRIGDGTLDGYLWLSQDALASRKVSYVAPRPATSSRRPPCRARSKPQCCASNCGPAASLPPRPTR